MVAALNSLTAGTVDIVSSDAQGAARTVEGEIVGGL